METGVIVGLIAFGLVFIPLVIVWWLICIRTIKSLLRQIK